MKCPKHFQAACKERVEARTTGQAIAACRNVAKPIEIASDNPDIYNL